MEKSNHTEALSFTAGSQKTRICIFHRQKVGHQMHQKEKEHSESMSSNVRQDLAMHYKTCILATNQEN